MKQEIKLISIYNAELYTRTKAAEIKECIRDDADEVVLDFSDITFISRSFADELYNVMEDMAPKQFKCIQRNEVVATMMEKVFEGRSRERIRGISHAKMYEFTDIDSLSNFLLTQ